VAHTHDGENSPAAPRDPERGHDQDHAAMTTEVPSSPDPVTSGSGYFSAGEPGVLAVWGRGQPYTLKPAVIDAARRTAQGSENRRK